MSNIGKSIRRRLLETARSNGMEYMKILVRYLHERLLFRVSVSDYRDNFCLKGGSLLYAYQGLNNRPTLDIDLLADRISNGKGHLRDVFSRICQIDCEADGVTFDASHIVAEDITIDQQYPGTKLTIIAHLDTIRQPISIDIGFGDVVTPQPIEIVYPTILDLNLEISLKAYSLESVIAEKLHAMVVRDLSNSRMKDFFDCYQILSSNQVDELVLAEAIRQTFEHRGTNITEDLQLFTDGFAKDNMRNQLWLNFLKKIKWSQTISFVDVMQIIRDRLEIYVTEYRDKR